jgi:hypothetical protein
VTRRIVFADVRLGLDDDARGRARGRAVHEDFAEKLFDDD